MPASDERPDGWVIIRLDTIGTVVFVLTALPAAIWYTSGLQWIAAITALGLFFFGIVAFLWSFWNAVQRSRAERVAVSQVYLLIGGVAPRRVQRAMWTLLALQIAIGLGTALARPNDLDGSPGTSLALGVLVPVFGFGMNGLWAAFHGSYADRDDVGTGGRSTPVPIDQNEDHA